MMEARIIPSLALTCCCCVMIGNLFGFLLIYLRADWLRVFGCGLLTA